MWIWLQLVAWLCYVAGYAWWSDWPYQAGAVGGTCPIWSEAAATFRWASWFRISEDHRCRSDDATWCLLGAQNHAVDFANILLSDLKSSATGSGRHSRRANMLHKLCIYAGNTASFLCYFVWPFAGGEWNSEHKDFRQCPEGSEFGGWKWVVDSNRFPRWMGIFSLQGVGPCGGWLRRNAEEWGWHGHLGVW